MVEGVECFNVLKNVYALENFSAELYIDGVQVVGIKHPDASTKPAECSSEMPYTIFVPSNRVLAIIHAYPQMRLLPIALKSISESESLGIVSVQELQQRIRELAKASSLAEMVKHIYNFVKELRLPYVTEFIHALAYGFLSPVTGFDGDLTNVIEPVVLREKDSDAYPIGYDKILSELFPEVKRLRICLPGEECSSHIPTLPSSVLNTFPIVIGLARAVNMSRKGKNTLLIVEEPELGLDFEKCRILSRHMVKAVNENPKLSIVMSTHSEEFLISMLREVAKNEELHKATHVYEFTKNGQVIEREVDEYGFTVIEFMKKELEEIYFR